MIIKHQVIKHKHSINKSMLKINIRNKYIPNVTAGGVLSHQSYRTAFIRINKAIYKAFKLLN